MKEKLKGRKCFSCPKKGCIGLVNLKAYCSIECQAKLGIYLANKKREKAEKEFKRETKQRRNNAMTNSEWQKRLQKLVNQWVLHVRDKGKPCCTCGTTNPNIKYDAGHFISVGAKKELRFETKNIHKQCSNICNIHASGARSAYNEFILKEYGKETYDWLIGPHQLLKDTFRHWTDYDEEIKRYRKLIREAGLKPAT